MEVNKFVSGGVVQVRIVQLVTFSHGFPVKVWGAYCTSVRIVFEILRYLKSKHGKDVSVPSK